MKTILILLLSASCCFADEYRVWTQLGSGKKITAKIIEKSKDNASTRVVLKSGKAYWLKAVDLVAKDQDFIASWGEPEEFKHLEVTESDKPATRAGFKMIHVIARALDKPLKVTAFERKARPGSVSHRVAPGKTVEFDAEVKENYVVIIRGDDNVCLEYANAGTRLLK